jgi:hypothetical protein
VHVDVSPEGPTAAYGTRDDLGSAADVSTDPEVQMRTPTALGLVVLLLVIIGAAALQLELAAR